MAERERHTRTCAFCGKEVVYIIEDCNWYGRNDYMPTKSNDDCGCELELAMKELKRMCRNCDHYKGYCTSKKHIEDSVKKLNSLNLNLNLADACDKITIKDATKNCSYWKIGMNIFEK